MDDEGDARESPGHEAQTAINMLVVPNSARNLLSAGDSANIAVRNDAAATAVLFVSLSADKKIPRAEAPGDFRLSFEKLLLHHPHAIAVFLRTALRAIVGQLAPDIEAVHKDHPVAWFR